MCCSFWKNSAVLASSRVALLKGTYLRTSLTTFATACRAQAKDWPKYIYYYSYVYGHILAQKFSCAQL